MVAQNAREKQWNSWNSRMGRASSAVPPATTSRGGAAIRISSSVVFDLPRDVGRVSEVLRTDPVTGTTIGRDFDIEFSGKTYRVSAFALRTFLNKWGDCLDESAAAPR